MPFSRSRSVESRTRSATSWFARKAPDCHSSASTSVVGAVDAAVELHEEPLGAERRALHPVHAELGPRLRGVLREVAGPDAGVATTPVRPTVVGQPDAGGGDADREPVGLAGPGDDRV